MITKKLLLMLLLATLFLGMAPPGVVIADPGTDVSNVEAYLIDSPDVYTNYGYDVSKIVDPYIYRSEVITEGHLPLVYNLNLKKSIKLNEKSYINEFLSKTEKDKQGFDSNAITYSYYILINESYKKSVPVYETGFIHNGNETDEVMNFTGYNVVDDYRYVWREIKDLNELDLKQGNVILDIVGHFKANLKPKQVDIIPQVKIGNFKKQFDKYAWWNSSWSYYKVWTITNPLIDYQLNITIGYDEGGDVDLEGHARSDFGDVRFLRSDNATELDYWRENYTSSTQATFWVNNSYNDSTIFIYYGNGNAITTSNGANVFIFFDDCESGGMAANGWVVTNGTSASSNYNNGDAFQGSRSILQDDDSTTYKTQAHETFLNNTYTATRTGFKLKRTAYLDSSNYMRIYIGHTSVGTYTTFYWYGDGNLKFYNVSSVEDTGYDYATATWEKFQFNTYGTGGADYYCHCYLNRVDIGNVKRQGYTLQYIDSFFIQSETSFRGTHYVDDIYVANWTNGTIPTYSFDVENLYQGTLGLNCFNESNPNQAIGFDILITNENGSQTYEANGLSNTEWLNLSETPFGENTIFLVTNSSYKQRTYYFDMDEGNTYNFTFYLPPIETPVANGSGDDGGNTTATQLFLLQIMDEVQNPVKNAKITIKRYINTTDSYQIVTSVLADGYGQADVYLIPGALYQVTITKTDYETEISYYIPSNSIYTHTFMLKYEEITPEEGNVEPEEVIFEGYISGDTLYLNYTDSMQQTINTLIYVYEINLSTNASTLFFSDSRSGFDDFQVYTTINTTNSYKAILYYSHETFGSQKRTLMFSAFNETLTNESRSEGIFDAIYGTNPIGWTNVIMFLILCAGMYYADEEDSGVILILIGGLFIFINSFVGFNTVLSVVFGGGIPALFIIVGIVVTWNTKLARG